MTAETQSPKEDQGYGFFDDDDGPVIGAIKTTASATNPSKEPAKAATQKDAEANPRKPSGEDTQSETVRVHVSLLDNLMNLIGEQVLIRNQILQHSKVNDADTELAKFSQRLNIITAELQKEVMKTRMQPIGNILNKFHRMVRDLGRDLNKKIELELVGMETELDKTIIEAVKDPLTHIIRNALDHGVESATDRKLVGKSEVAKIQVRAYHESGQVIIEVSDDGKGLDRRLIGTKAVEKGLVSVDGLSRMSEREINQLIFTPGFSTAATVSAISGRGVGMDVVKTNVERIGGVVDIQSMPGSGTTVSLKIPLTLAIVPALVVRAKGQRFAIPRSKLVELVLIEESDSAQVRIESLQGSPVLRLRGKVLPLLCLSEVLQRPGTFEPTDYSKTNEAINVAVVNADGNHYGLIIDSVEDTADVVVKALPPFLKDIIHFSGATIMGDGSVALTIDVAGVSAASHFGTDIESFDKVETVAEVQNALNSKNNETVEFLIVELGTEGSYAIPLTLVSRLEEFSAEQFHLSGEQRVVRYRDALLPIFSLPEFLKLQPEGDRPKKTKFPVIVIRRGESIFGIEVDMIQDVVSLSARIDKSIRDRPGILGTIIAGDKVMVVVDILGMIDSVRTRLIQAGGGQIQGDFSGSRPAVVAKRRHHRILLAEDSSFFRTYIKQILEEAGFQADTAIDGAEAWKMLDTASQGHFAMVLSDIEMPSVDGLELAQRIVGDPRFQGLPLVAITTKFSNLDVEKGKKAGFMQYIEKLKIDDLLGEIDNLLIKQPTQGSSIREVKHAVGNR